MFYQVSFNNTVNELCDFHDLYTFTLCNVYVF